MCKLTVLSSNSKANCYLLKIDEKILILEAGVKLLEVKKAINFDISKIVGCVVSHEHKDHARYVDEISEVTRVYTSFENFKKIKIEEFTITPFENFHDVECFGFHIYHEKIGNLLFATDTKVLKYKFKKINHMMIECNYIDSMIDNEYLRHRLVESHLSLDTCVDTLKKYDLSNLNNLILLHLSKQNADESIIKKTIINETGFEPIIAKKNLVIELGF